MGIVGFGKINRILDLIAQCEKCLDALNWNRTDELRMSFNKARAILQTTTERTQSVALLLSAARRHMIQAEAETAEWITGNAYYPIEQINELFSLRQACAVTVVVITDALNETRQSPRPGNAYWPIG
jgi:hypothetical protein